MSKELPIVPIQLDKVRHLKFTGRTFRLIEQETGKNCLMGEIWATMNFNDLVTIIWAACLHEDEKLDIETVAEVVNPANYLEFMDKIKEAWTDAVPEPPNADELKEMSEKDLDELPLGVNLPAGVRHKVRNLLRHKKQKSFGDRTGKPGGMT